MYVYYNVYIFIENLVIQMKLIYVLLPKREAIQFEMYPGTVIAYSQL